MTNTIIDSKDLGTVEGFNLRAVLVPDVESDSEFVHAPEPDAELLIAYNYEQWNHVGTIVIASKAGVDLGEASLWGSQYGMIPGVARWVSPLDGEGDDLINGYGPQLIREAIASAQAKLAEINGVDNAVESL